MFKPLQVVHTTKSLRNLKGQPVAIGTRVTVINVKGSIVTARGDKRPSPTERAYRIVGPVEAFAPTKRGRKATKKGKRTKAPVVAEVSVEDSSTQT